MIDKMTTFTSLFIILNNIFKFEIYLQYFEQSHHDVQKSTRIQLQNVDIFCEFLSINSHIYSL